MLLRIALALASLEPRPAVELGAWLTGAPADDLRAVVWRESRFTAQAIHRRGDAHWSTHVCERGMAVGWLAAGRDCSAGGWSTRGIAGLMAAYHLRYIGLDRWPCVLDIPIASAIAAGRKYRARCPGRGAGWCPRGARSVGRRGGDHGTGVAVAVVVALTLAPGPW